MNDYVTQKIALGFAIGAFTFMVFGSLLASARFMTAFIRGFEGALIFGGLAWGLSWYLLKNSKPDSEIEEESTSEP